MIKDNIQKQFFVYRRMVDSYLRMIIKKLPDYSKVLKEGIEYALFPGGKRLRPILCLFSYFASGGKSKEEVLPFAAALEMIHSFSLVHDDLPAIDNDEIRRGRPTLHRVFGEGVAILVGDCLLSLAFETILRAIRRADCSAGTKSLSLSSLAEMRYQAGEVIFSACQAMVSGQVMELTDCSAGTLCEAGTKSLSSMVKSDLLNTNYFQVIEKKTGALIVSSILVGAILAGLERKKLLVLKKAASAFGLAFQLADDIKDGDGSVRLYGREKTETLERFYTKRAVFYFKKLGERFAPFLGLIKVLGFNSDCSAGTKSSGR